MVGDWLQGWFNICHQAEMHIHKYTKTSKLLPDFYSPGASLQGNLFRFIPHIDIQSSSNQTLILCTLLPIEPTIGEIISFDLLEEKRGEVDLSKKGDFTPSLGSLGLWMDFPDPTSICGT